jgi:mono/diheme cytochrome c family protein
MSNMAKSWRETSARIVTSSAPASSNRRMPMSQAFPGIANKEGQTAGSIMAHIVLPKHPMPTIPLTQSELADLAAYILTLRESK